MASSNGQKPDKPTIHTPDIGVIRDVLASQALDTSHSEVCKRRAAVAMFPPERG